MTGFEVWESSRTEGNAVRDGALDGTVDAVGKLVCDCAVLDGTGAAVGYMVRPRRGFRQPKYSGALGSPHSFLISSSDSRN